MPDVNEVFEKLKESATNDRVRRTLDAIHKICKEQSDRGSLDFSISTISRIGEDVGIPKAQSIRNKTGEAYRTLINGWKNSNSTQLNRPKISKKNDWIEKIADPTIRFLVYDLVTKNRKLTSELQLVKSVKTLEIDMRNDREVALPVGQSIPKLVDSEWEALASAITPKFLKNRDWKADTRGRVTDSDGKTVFKNGFITALEKITAIKN